MAISDSEVSDSMKQGQKTYHESAHSASFKVLVKKVVVGSRSRELAVHTSKLLHITTQWFSALL